MTEKGASVEEATLHRNKKLIEMIEILWS